VNFHNQGRAVAALVVTLALIHFVPHRLFVLGPLLLSWGIIFHPVSRRDWAAFGIAGTFFLMQNYLALRSGIFEFRYKDILLMPYYEPFLWGFYFLFLTRVLGEGETLRIDWKSIAGVVVTSIAFSLSVDSRTLLVATACSTAFLLALFHSKKDIQYAITALALGLVIELFGVSTGLWWYPEPDFLGIPFWFATMWMSVGLLGRRFLIPAATWLSERGRQRAYRPGARIP
jgi:hypothetical protein